MKTNIRAWLSQVRDHFGEHPTRAPLHAVYPWYLAGWFAITSRHPIGTNVFDREWDVLVVLDACRVDTLRAVADEYDFISDVDEMWSVGSHSAEWMTQTFTESYRTEIEQTRYITGNPHTKHIFDQQIVPPIHNALPVDVATWDVVDGNTFESIETVWEHYADDTYGVTLPGTMTDYAIRTARTHDPDKLIVHYMQPHRPYIGKALPENRPPSEVELEGYNLVKSGEEDSETVYELYEETLRLVLNEVGVLLENIDAETVAITADHGEDFGEAKAYGHPEGFPHPVVKKVPWVTTSARDQGTRDPDLSVEHRASVDVEEHLRDLGYR